MGYTQVAWGNIPGVGEGNSNVFVRLGRWTAPNNEPLKLDTDVAIAAIGTRPFEWNHATVVDGSYIDSGETKYHTITFNQSVSISGNPCTQWDPQNLCILQNSRHKSVQYITNFKKTNGRLIITSTASGFTSDLTKNLTIGAEGVYTTVRTLNGNSIVSNVKGQGDIIIHSHLGGTDVNGNDVTAELFVDSEFATPIVQLGATYLRGSYTNNARIAIAGKATLYLDMRNNAFANASGEKVTLMEGGTIKQLAANQLQANTTLRFQLRSIDTVAGNDAGTFDMGGYNLGLENLYLSAQNKDIFVTQNKNFVTGTIDFGRTTEIDGEGNLVSSVIGNQNDLIISNGIVIDPDSSELDLTRCFIYLKNMDADDRILAGFNSTFDDSILSDEMMKFFVVVDAEGNVIDGTWNKVYDDNAGYWAHTFTAIPEPSTFAVIFGALALGFVAYRRRK